MSRVVSLLDLTLPSGTLYLSDIEDDRTPNCVAKLTGPIRLSRSLRSPFYGLQATHAQRRHRVLSDVDAFVRAAAKQPLVSPLSSRSTWMK